MTSFVQKILVDSNQQEFAMKQMLKKGIPEFMRKPLMLTVQNNSNNAKSVALSGRVDSPVRAYIS